MKRFARLYTELDESNRTSEKLRSLERYFRESPPEDAAWGLYFLTGRKTKRVVKYSVLKQCALEASGVPEWLFDECHAAVGDYSETAALLLPKPAWESDEAIEPIEGSKAGQVGSPSLREGRAPLGLPATSPEREREGTDVPENNPLAHARGSLPLHQLVQRYILPLPSCSDAQAAALLMEVWERLASHERFVYHKLLSVNFRVGVQRRLVARALAAVAGIDAAVMEHRLIGNYTPTPEAYLNVISPHADMDDVSKPYPFCLATQLESSPPATVDAAKWQIEWKWDGIRAQLIRRTSKNGTRSVVVWSRGEELITDQFPELRRIAAALPDDAVLDGEVLAWTDEAESGGVNAAGMNEGNAGTSEPSGASRRGRRGSGSGVEELATHPAEGLRPSAQIGKDIAAPSDGLRRGHPLPFGVLQTRLNRKGVSTARGLFDRTDLVFMAYDLLEIRGEDCRAWPLSSRREALEQLVASVADDVPLRVSPVMRVTSWDEAAALRERASEIGAEGLMLKPLASPYGVGRTRGDLQGDAASAGWWKWKIDPLSLDAVLIAAQPGSGKRASLFTDYTFGLWHDEALVPFAKAYSGLDDSEIARVDAFVRRNTLTKMGPVRAVKPQLVFEIAFEAIRESPRHKSGIAVRFPRIARWRHDKAPEAADTLETARQLLKLFYGSMAPHAPAKKSKVTGGARSAGTNKRKEQSKAPDNLFLPGFESGGVSSET